jgi:hypothetical protein
MKNVLDLLYKDKAPEERPKICVIRTQSTVTPDEKLTYEQWAKEHKVGITWNNTQDTNRANQMMSLYDEKTICTYIKNKNIG